MPYNARIIPVFENFIGCHFLTELTSERVAFVCLFFTHYRIISCLIISYLRQHWLHSFWSRNLSNYVGLVRPPDDMFYPLCFLVATSTNLLDRQAAPPARLARRRPSQVVTYGNCHLFLSSCYLSTCWSFSENCWKLFG